MALAEYVCGHCGQSQYVFEGEEDRLPREKCKRFTQWAHAFEKMPPSCMIVHATELFMISQLDSIHTIDELDQKETRDAADEREAKQHVAARREL